MATWTVAQTGGDYSSIADAVSNPNTQNEDIIQVSPGTYNPTGTIGRSDLLTLTISGTNEDATSVIIQADNVGATVISASSNMSASGWVMKNFSIHNANVGGGNGVFNMGVSSSAENIIISGTSWNGFDKIMSGVEISRCIVTAYTGTAMVGAFGPGVDNKGAIIRSCLIHHGGGGSSNGGILLFGSGTVQHNTIAAITGVFGISLQGAGGRIEHNIVSKQSQIGAAVRSGFYTLDASIVTAYNLSYGHTGGGSSPEYNLAGGSGSGDQGEGDVPNQDQVFVDENNYNFLLHMNSPARLASTGSGDTGYRDINNRRYVFHSASKGCYAATTPFAPSWTTDPPTITAQEQATSLVITWSAEASGSIHQNDIEYQLTTRLDATGDIVSTMNVLSPTTTATVTGLNGGTQYGVTVTPIDSSENAGSGYSVTASTSRAWTHTEGGTNSKTSITTDEYIINSIAVDRNQRGVQSQYNSVSTTGVAPPLGTTRRGVLSLRGRQIPYSCSFGG